MKVHYTKNNNISIYCLEVLKYYKITNSDWGDCSIRVCNWISSHATYCVGIIIICCTLCAVPYNGFSTFPLTEWFLETAQARAG